MEVDELLDELVNPTLLVELVDVLLVEVELVEVELLLDELVNPSDDVDEVELEDELSSIVPLTK